MKKGWIPFFKTGTHKDSKGRERSWTAEQLDLAATHFNGLSPEEKLKRPITISHPKSNLPVMGIVERVKRVGETLYALPGKVADGFKELVNQGELPERSISFFSDGTINHFGFLPKGQKAAVQGLGTFNFSKEDNAIQLFNFSEGAIITEDSDDGEIVSLKAQITALTAEIAALKNEKQTINHESKIGELETKLAKQSAQIQTMNFSAKLPEKLSPAQKSLFIKLHESLGVQASGNMEFSDGGSDTPENILLQLAGLTTNSLEFSEFATKSAQGGDPGRKLSDTDTAAAIISRSMKH